MPAELPQQELHQAFDVHQIRRRTRMMRGEHVRLKAGQFAISALESQHQRHTDAGVGDFFLESTIRQKPQYENQDRGEALAGWY